MTWPFHLVVNATRYCMGRTSYAVGEHVGWLVAHWDELDANTRECIRRDLEKEFGRDDDARSNATAGSPCRLPLGMDCDRMEWEMVRDLYRTRWSPMESALTVGDRVVKDGGDYRFAGAVVAAFTKNSGQVRYVVENADGILHIFSLHQLRKVDT